MLFCVQQIPDLQGLFDDLQDEINFNLDQILSQDTRDSLSSFADAGLNTLDYLTYVDQIRSQLSTVNVSKAIGDMETVRLRFSEVMEVSWEVFGRWYIQLLGLGSIENFVLQYIMKIFSYES